LPAYGFESDCGAHGSKLGERRRGGNCDDACGGLRGLFVTALVV
jgi:hypothetical protein